MDRTVWVATRSERGEGDDILGIFSRSISAQHRVVDEIQNRGELTHGYKSHYSDGDSANPLSTIVYFAKYSLTSYHVDEIELQD